MQTSDYNRLLQCEAAFADAEADPSLEAYYACMSDVDEEEGVDEEQAEVLYAMATGVYPQNLVAAFVHRFCHWPGTTEVGARVRIALMPPSLTASRQMPCPMVP
jgi:hypothetical protein